MDSSDLERLLEPVSPESPCGPDLEYDSEFGEMERAAQGKGDQQFGDTIVAAEPPDWKDVRRLVEGLLERTRDMRVALYLSRCLLQLEGLLGFELALRLMRGYLETFWEDLYPELDRSDNDDPTYRINTLIALCDEETILRELRDAPLVSSRAMGQFSLRDIERSHEVHEQPEEKPQSDWASEGQAPSTAPSGPSAATIEAAFKDAAVEDLQATEEATRLAAEHVAAIEQYVTEQVGAAQATSLAPLQNLLLEMNTALVSQLERRGVYAEEPESESEDADESSGAPGETADADAQTSSFVSGNIGTREEAIKALDKVCEYYERNEPSSPLPLLIRRAQRLASKSFLDILRDLAPDAVSQAEALGGGVGFLEAAAADASSDTESPAAPQESSDW